MHGSVGGRSGGRVVLIVIIYEGYRGDGRNRGYRRYDGYKNYLME
jgi:hypothetical protein